VFPVVAIKVVTVRYQGAPLFRPIGFSKEGLGPALVLALVLKVGATHGAEVPPMTDVQSFTREGAASSLLIQQWFQIEEESACGDLTEISQKLEAILVNHPSGKDRLAPSVEIRGTPPHLAGEAQLVHDDVLVFSKRVDAHNCQDALEALVLSLEIFLEDFKIAETPSATRDTPSTEKASKRQSGTEDIDPFSLSELQVPSPSPDLPREDRMMLAGPLVTSGALPATLGGDESGLGGSLGGGLLARGHVAGDWYFVGEVRMLMAPERSFDGADYRFSSTALFLGPGLHWPLSRVFALRADGALVGNVTRVAYDSPRAEPGSLNRPSFGGALHAGMSAFPWTSLLMELRAGAVALAARGRYLNGSGELVWQEPVVSLAMGVFVGWASRAAAPGRKESWISREGFEPRWQW
jgi:hypothetical protein